ncbi:MAG: glycosyltransferase family 39 protein [Patescibacteria group bacterium]
MKKFLQDNWEFILLFLILVLASILRFYKIDQYMTFLGDEGRDAIAVKRMVVDLKPRLIGPVTSIGNMYLGPLYYYFIAPSMLIGNLSPVSLAAFVAMIGVITVGLVWMTAREWFGKFAGICSSFLFAISPVVIIYSRSSWNPNVMPFFAILTAWGVYQVWVKRNYLWLLGLGVTLSFATQSHYLGILLIPFAALFGALAFIELVRKKKPLKKFVFLSLGAIGIFLTLTVAPLVWFDLRHGFINLNAFKAFFTVRQETVNLKVYKALPGLWELATQFVSRVLTAKNDFFGKWFLSGLSLALASFAFLGIKRKNFKNFINQEKGLIIVLAWLFIGLLGLGNYKQHIYDHYFGFLYPAIFLFLGWILTKLWDLKLGGKVFTLAVVLLLTFLSVSESPLKYPPNNQLEKTKAIARLIAEKAEGKPFNLGLIAECNYDDSYNFFLEIWEEPVVEIEALRAEETITDQLFVICEKLPCEPPNAPQAEIANFGWSKIVDEWEVKGIKIYKLTHSLGNEN